MRNRYPPYAGARIPIAEAVRRGGGPVAGRWRADRDGPRLVDASADVAVSSHDGTPDHGDWVSAHLDAVGMSLRGVIVHARSRRASPDPSLPSRLPALEARARIEAAARGFFRERGFLEVATPSRVVNPGLEPHLRAFPASRDKDRWLITSPELHLKRVLAAGAERVVEFSRAFRDDESGPWHAPEFTLVEWYRTWEGLDALERDCEDLVAACAEAASLDTPPRFDRTTVRAALRERTGLDLADLRETESLAAAVRAQGHAVAPDDDWDTVFFRVWIAEVERTLGVAAPTFVGDWPASQAALARTGLDGDGFPVARRFELYVRGVEIANAFDELNDPDEQRRRHEADRAARAAAGADVYPLDEAFLGALEAGMPPAAGIALGLDRLVAVLLGAGSIADVTAFPGD